MFFWPALANGLTATITPLAGPAFPFYGINHQGRVVVLDKSLVGFSSSAMYRDYLTYSAVDSLATATTVLQYGESSQGGTGFMVSLTADQLLVVKNNGGGYIISGDIANPTVRHLPYIEPANGITSTPASSNIGLVYGTRNGVFNWAGGVTSEKLSNQIDGFFWDHTNASTTETYMGQRARFDYFHPWIAVPNNYLYDTRTKAWWRLEAPTINGSTPYNVYGVGPSSGKLYAFPYKLTATQNTLWDVYDSTILATDYAWNSQPLVESMDRVQSFQDVTIVASPGSNTSACTITVTLTGFNGTGVAVTPVAVDFQFTGDGSGSPVILRKLLAANFTAMYVTCNIAASGGSNAAPKIHKITIGHSDRTRNPLSV
jgi:hypothetical protein